MYICFVLSELSSLQKSGDTHSVAGNSWHLHPIRSSDEGPWYPHFAEKTTEESYHFFAGKIAGVVPSNELPTHHAVNSNPLDAWDFKNNEPDGSWIALKFDRQHDTLTIASDLFLIQHWYYTCHGGNWYFSNSLLFLQRVLKGALEIDQRCAPYIIQYSFLPLQYTPLKDVFQLRTGYFLVVEKGKPRLEFRAQLPIRYRFPQIRDGIPQAIYTSLREAVAQELTGLDSVVIPISGGLDSRFLLGCALELLEPEQITTMTFGHPNSLDMNVGNAIAKKVGVRHIVLPPDERPIYELIEENFVNAEGIYWSYPDYPVGSMREALSSHSYILSGYIGFRTGAWFFLPGKPLEGTMQHALVSYLLQCSYYSPPKEVKRLMADGNPDPFNFESTVTLIPGAGLLENWEYWEYENYLLNRNNSSLQLFRNRAFYMAPFMHKSSLDVSYSIPAGGNLCERYFFAAHKFAFPELAEFPTTRNFGFPLGTPKNFRVNMTRAWRKMRSLIDDIIGAPLGLQLYQHPRNNYTHARELFRKEYRKYVADSLDELKGLEVFDAAYLEKVKRAYLHNRRLSPYLLRGLLTVHQWMRQYRKPQR